MSEKGKKTRVGLVGAGYVSTHHAAALRSLCDVEIVGVADLDIKRAQELAERFSIPLAVRSLDEMKEAGPEFIHVLTPPAHHADVAVRALEMGCHVFVEKPMAESAADCDRMIAATKHAGRVLSVNHSARMDPIILRASELVQSGAIGQVLAVDFLRSSDYAAYRGGPDVPPQFRSGAYPFQDLGIHGLSIFETFLGKLQQLEVQFESSGRDLALTFDEWRATARCERGTGRIYLSWNVRPLQNEIIIYGTDGIIHVDCFLQTCTRRAVLPGPKFGSMVVNALRSAVSTQFRVPINVLRFMTGRLSGSPGIHVSIARFYDAVRQGLPVPIPADEGRRLIAAMEGPCCQANQEKARMRKAMIETPLAPARILVTGAGGFLGRALTERLLREGERPRILVRRTPESGFDPRLQVVYGDLGDPEVVDRAVKGVSVVYHVGAATKGSVADFERGTVWGTRNVVEACLRHGVERLVHVSSLSVLDHAGHQAGQVVDENWPYEPHADRRGAYTQTKLEAEKTVLDAVRGRGLAAVVLRPGQIFGPASSEAPAGVIAVAGRWIVVGRGRLPLPLVYVDDVVEAIALAGKASGPRGGIFHIVDQEFVSQREYIDLFRERSSALKVLYAPVWMLRCMGILCDGLAKVLGRRLPLSTYRIRSIRPLSNLDISAAGRGLKWSPTVGVREGLARTFKPVTIVSLKSNAANAD